MSQVSITDDHYPLHHPLVRVVNITNFLPFTEVAVSLPTSPTSFGGTKVDSSANSIIESLNLQI